jgi:hypothetical protein
MRAVTARRARARVAIAVVSVLASAGLAAGANAATIAVTATTPNPEQAIPVGLSFTGSADPGASSNLEAVVRPAGGIACQPDYASDLSAAGSADSVLFSSDAQSVSPGSYEFTATYKPPAAGSYQVCAWLSQPPAGAGGAGGTGGTGTSSSGDAVVAGPSTASFTARPPQVSQLTLAVPSSLTPGVIFQLAYTTQTDQQLSLYSLITKAGALPCADSYELELQESQPGTTTLLGPGDQQVFGGPTSTRLTTRQKAGSYLICSWLEGPAAGEVDSTLSTPLTIGTPTSTPVPARLGLRLGTVSASRTHGVTVTGSAASRFTGRVTVLAACGAATRQARPAVRTGRFSTHLALPAGCRSHRQVTVKVTWAGSPAFARSSTSRSVAIRR